VTRECTISIIHTSYHELIQTIPSSDANTTNRKTDHREANRDAYSQTQSHATTNTREREERGREAEHAG